MSQYLSPAQVNAAFNEVARYGLSHVSADVVELAALGVWHGAAPDMDMVCGPHLDDAFDLAERLSFYNVVSSETKKTLLGKVRSHRQSTRFGGSQAFEKAFNRFLPQLQPLQTRHYASASA